MNAPREAAVREPDPEPSQHDAPSHQPDARNHPTDAAEYAARALEVAGCVLAPEPRSEADLRLSQTLLRESLIAAARIATKDSSIVILEQATAALATRRDLAPGRQWKRVLDVADHLRADRTALPERLIEAERALGRAMEKPRGRQPRPTVSQRTRWLMVGGFAFIVAAVAATPSILRHRWENYRWTASSAAFRLGQTGTLADHGIMGLLFHTAEEAEPWILIDMLETRSVDRVIVKNRFDCCFDRGLPLLMEVGQDLQSMTLVGRQREPFDVWKAEFSAREARYVRIRSEATAAIHFRAIEIP